MVTSPLTKSGGFFLFRVNSSSATSSFGGGRSDGTNAHCPFSVGTKLPVGDLAKSSLLILIIVSVWIIIKHLFVIIRCQTIVIKYDPVRGSAEALAPD